MIALLFLSALLLPCEGAHLWEHRPAPGLSYDQGWYCVRGDHRGKKFFAWDE